MLVKLTTDDYWKKLLRKSDLSISRRLIEKAEKMSKENVFGSKWHKQRKAVSKFIFQYFGNFLNKLSPASNVANSNLYLGAWKGGRVRRYQLGLAYL